MRFGVGAHGLTRPAWGSGAEVGSTIWIPGYSAEVVLCVQ